MVLLYVAGADPGCQPGARVGAFRKERPIQRAERGVYPAQVAAPVCQDKPVGDSDLANGQPGVALQAQRLSQVYLKVAVQAGLAVQGQRLIPLQVAHHLLEARALAEAVGPRRLHLFKGYCAATSPAARSTPLRSARA